MLVVFPNNANCSGLAGRASLDCSRSSSDGSPGVSWAIQRHDQMNTRDRAVKLTTHEMGHNLGLHHGSSLDYGTEALGDPASGGTLNEYGGIFSTMGSWNLGHYDSEHKVALGWLPNLQTVSTSGSFNIAPYSTSAGTMALRVDRGATSQDLWIEFRRRLGQYATSKGDASTHALIHLNSYGGKTRLLDFTPGTSSFGDGGLAVGQSWTDPYTNLTIETVSASDSALNVNITYGAVPCTTQDPTVSISPSSLTVNEPDPAVYLVSVQNNGSSACDSQSFDLSALIAGPNALALGSSFTPSSLTVAPQSSLSTNLTVTPTASPANGVHTVTATATKSDQPASSDSAIAGLTILEPSATLSLSLSGNGRVAIQGTGQTCTDSCSFTYPESTWSALDLVAENVHRKHSFCSWTGACDTTQNNTDGVCRLSAYADYTVGAIFASKCPSDDGGGGGGGNGGGKGGGKPPK